VGVASSSGGFSLHAGRPTASDRHAQDVLIGLDQTVADFDGGAEGDLGLLRGDHHAGQTGARVAQFEGLGEVAGVLLGVVDAADRVAEGVGEAAAGLGGLGRVEAGREAIGSRFRPVPRSLAWLW
jgi:hypothetical protein